MNTEEEKENVKLWKSVEDTDPDFMHEVEYPFPHISIDAQYQVLTATKLWGAMGDKWGVKNQTFIPIPLPTKNVCSVIYSATFFHPDGEFDISSDIFLYNNAKGTYKQNNDYAKKVSTDAMTKGLSKLGFSADVFMGKFDGGKYEGIESFLDVEKMSPEQAKTLNEYIKDFETTSPQTANWVKKQLSKGLSKEEADKKIEDCKQAKAGIKAKAES